MAEFVDDGRAGAAGVDDEGDGLGGVLREECADLGEPFVEGLGVEGVAGPEGESLDVPNYQFGHTDPVPGDGVTAFDGPLATSGGEGGEIPVLT